MGPTNRMCTLFGVTLNLFAESIACSTLMSKVKQTSEQIITALFTASTSPPSPLSAFWFAETCSILLFSSFCPVVVVICSAVLPLCSSSGITVLSALPCCYYSGFTTLSPIPCCSHNSITILSVIPCYYYSGINILSVIPYCYFRGITILSDILELHDSG